MFTRLSFLCLAALLAGFSGCGPARVDSQIQASLDRGSKPDARFEVPSVKAERTISVEANSTNSEIDIYVVKKSDVEKFMTYNYEQRGTKSLASKQKIKSGSLAVVVPANTEITVMVMLSDKGDMKKSDVTGRITSK